MITEIAYDGDDVAVYGDDHGWMWFDIDYVMVNGVRMPDDVNVVCLVDEVDLMHDETVISVTGKAFMDPTGTIGDLCSYHGNAPHGPNGPPVFESLFEED